MGGMRPARRRIKSTRGAGPMPYYGETQPYSRHITNDPKWREAVGRASHPERLEMTLNGHRSNSGIAVNWYWLFHIAGAGVSIKKMLLWGRCKL